MWETGSSCSGGEPLRSGDEADPFAGLSQWEIQLALRRYMERFLWVNELPSEGGPVALPRAQKSVTE
ncbi:MAG: hypothetical protein JXA20_13870 [Spirochaetes bacterium]|nr:hypothetical protein [Spirochaetota bacterium]